MAESESVLSLFRLKKCIFFYFYFLSFMHFEFVICLKAELYTTRTFGIIHGSSYPHFVMFYAPWCGHCKRIQTLWDQYAEENTEIGRIKVAKVDCTDTTPLCVSERIKAYPTFRLFHNHDTYTYSGYRNIAGFNEFVNKNVQNIKDGQVPKTDVKFEHMKPETPSTGDNAPTKAKVLTGSAFREEIQIEFSFVDFYAPWCPHCVELEPVWDQLATSFKHSSQVTIAKVDCTSEPELCKQQQIQAYPTLRLFKDGKLLELYQGSRQLEHLVQFVSNALQQYKDYQPGEETSAEEASAEETSAEEPLIDDTQAFIQLEKNEDGEASDVGFIDSSFFTSHISSIPHLLYFHGNGFSTSEENIELFNQVAKELKAWEAKVIPAMVDCSVESNFCAKYKVTSFPSIKYFKTEDDFVSYRGPYDVLSIVRFAIDPDDLHNDKEAKVEL